MAFNWIELASKSAVMAVVLGFALPASAQDQNPLAAPPLEDDLPLVILDPNTNAEERGMQEIEGYLNDLESLSGNFIQQGPDGSINSGQFYMQRPGRIRFQYDGDLPILVVADGDTLNLVDYEVGQVTRWPIDDTPLAPIMAATVDFDENAYLVSQGPGELANMVAVTARDPKNPQQGSLTLMFSTTPSDNSGKLFGELTLRAWQVVDAQGSLTTVSVSELTENPILETGLWTFDDPRANRLNRRRRGR